jgi:hypothetical protein
VTGAPVSKSVTRAVNVFTPTVPGSRQPDAHGRRESIRRDDPLRRAGFAAAVTASRTGAARSAHR